MYSYYHVWAHEIFWCLVCARGPLTRKLAADHFFRNFLIFFLNQSTNDPSFFWDAKFLHLVLGLKQYIYNLDFTNKLPRNLVILQIPIRLSWACDSAFVTDSQGNADTPGPQTIIWVAGIQTWPFLGVCGTLYTVFKKIHYFSVKKHVQSTKYHNSHLVCINRRERPSSTWMD